MLVARHGEVKLLLERKAASEKERNRIFSPAESYLDTTGHFIILHAWENQLGKSGTHPPNVASEKEKNRIFSPAKSYLDQPEHFCKKYTGDNQLGKPEDCLDLENIIFEYKHSFKKFYPLNFADGML